MQGAGSCTSGVHLYVQGCCSAPMGLDEGWLGTHERSRARAMRHAPARNEFIVGRRLARLTVSRLLRVPPNEVEFVIDESGRPRLADRAPAQTQAHFSIAHSQGLVLCAASLEGPVGVDLEPLRRDAEVASIAERLLTPTERIALRQHPQARRHRWLLQRWVDKEAWSKVVGKGLQLHFGGITVVHDGEGRARFVREPGGQDTRGQLWHPRPRAGYLISVVRELSPRGPAALHITDLGDAG